MTEELAGEMPSVAVAAHVSLADIAADMRQMEQGLAICQRTLLRNYGAPY